MFKALLPCPGSICKNIILIVNSVFDVVGFIPASLSNGNCSQAQIKQCYVAGGFKTRRYKKMNSNQIM
jgi:hypothetical protein